MSGRAGKPRITKKVAEGLRLIRVAGPAVYLDKAGIRRWQDAEKFIDQILCWHNIGLKSRRAKIAAKRMNKGAGT